MTEKPAESVKLNVQVLIEFYKISIDKIHNFYFKIGSSMVN